MSSELVHRYRPKRFKDVIGQPEAASMLSKAIKRNTLPHALLFSGPAGCGKTSLARIVARKMQCGKSDFQEINAAETRGIDMIRGIKERMGLSPMNGPVRIWLLDELHALTNQAQQSFLKILEEPPDWVYFMLATTEPQRLIRTILSRCRKVRVRLLNDEELFGLLNKVCKSEGVEVSEDVQEKIIACAGGSARDALILLEGALVLDDEQEQLEWIEKSDTQKYAIDLARALIDKRVKWAGIVAILEKIEDDPEQVRRIVCRYVGKVMLNKNTKMSAKAYCIWDSFRQPFYGGHCDLYGACFSALHGGLKG